MSINGERIARLLDPFIEANKEAMTAYATLRRTILIEGELTREEFSKCQTALEACQKKVVDAQAALHRHFDHEKGVKPNYMVSAVARHVHDEVKLVPMPDIVQLEEEARKLWSSAVVMEKDALGSACIFGTPKHDDDFLAELMRYKERPEDFVEPVDIGIKGTISGRLSHHVNPCKEVATPLSSSRSVFHETQRTNNTLPPWTDMFSEHVEYRMDRVGHENSDPFLLECKSTQVRFCLTRNARGEISFFKASNGGWKKELLDCSYFQGGKRELFRFTTVAVNPTKGQRYVLVEAISTGGLEGISRRYNVKTGRAQPFQLALQKGV